MKNARPHTLLLRLAPACCVLALSFCPPVLRPVRAAEPVPPVPAETAKVKSLFDGKTLSGWEGDLTIWSVRDGVIRGGSLTETIRQNEFLASTAEYGNFVVRFKIKLTGNEGFVNSGFQIRSQRRQGDSEMIGYQCDFGDPDWYGCIYDESRRNRLMAKSDMKTLEPVLKRQDWNEYVIRADGARVTTWINGVMGVDYTEADPSLVQHGRLGIQVHGGGKAVVELKDITIEELPPTPKRRGAQDPAAEPEKKSAAASPLDPEAERAAISVAPGLELELVASEDLENGYGKFVAVQFDAKGRLWTMTAREYPVDANENAAEAEALYASKARDSVLVYDIESRGQEGIPVRYARKPRVFADGLAIPLGILPYRDGCYTQHGHEIALLRDTDGDGRADRRETVLTGFGVQDSHLFPHQFTRAPGGWIWMAQGAFNYSKVVGPEGKVTPFDQTRMARFRPDGAEFTITSNGPCNIWGLVMNGEGETFIQEANDFGYPVMPFHAYANYPGCSDSQWKSYAPEFPGTADFRMGGTGLSGLALTDAAGAFPEEWSDVMLVANPITSRIQAIKLHRQGTGWRLEKLPDVVISADEWFRPVGLTLGPDGAVYIVDWYNKIISHNEVPRNHPERDKKRGRIWRLKGKTQPGFAVPDFTAMTEKELTERLGHASLAQSHLAWQTLEDRAPLQPETVAALKEIAAGSRRAAAPGSQWADAAAIQALWVLRTSGADPSSAVEALSRSTNRNARREAAAAGLLPALAGLKDADPEVRWAALDELGSGLAQTISSGGPAAARDVIAAMVATAGPALPGPMAPSTHSGRPVRTGEAYEREFGRYLVRLHLEPHPQAVAAFLDSPAAAELRAESLMTACLALPPRESAPRVARLLAGLGRAPHDEEVLRLAEAPADPAVGEALGELIARPEGLEALLRQRARFDARALAPLLAVKVRTLLTENPPLALQAAAAFRLAELEPAIAALPPTPAVLNTLGELGSRRPDLFLPLTRSADPALRDAALSALITTPEQLLPLWPSMHAGQRKKAVAALAAQPPSAALLVAAVRDGRIPREELDGPSLERLQAVLKEDPALQALMESMTGLFTTVLELDGADGSFVDLPVHLSGAFTVECWVRLPAGMGNRDSLLAAPDQLDLNFYDGKFRVWVGGGAHDVAVAGKAIPPGVWTHVAVTRDAAGNFRIYLNGEPDAAGTKTDPRDYRDLRPLRSNVPQGTRGQFAEYRIWNACRTADEIRAAFDRTGLTEGSAAAAGISAAPGHGAAAPVLSLTMGQPWPGLRGGARMARTMDFPALVTPEAARALDAKFAHYRAMAEKPGDATRGKLLGAVCTACHLVNGEGGRIGPNLSSAGAMGTESLLRNILTPNAAMEPGYRVYRAELTDGSLREGFLAGEDETAIILRQPGGEDERLPKDQLRSAGFTRRSLMPEGLELSFSPAQWSDLFAWLRTLK